MMKKLFSIKSINFIVLVSIYFATVLDYKFWAKSLEIIQFANFSDIVFLISLPLFLFIPLFALFSLLTVKYVGKFFVIILLFCSAMSSYAMQYLGVVIDANMIDNVAETNVREATDLMTLKSGVYVFLTAVIPALWVMFVKIDYASILGEVKTRLKYFLLVILGLAVLAPFSYKSYVSYCRNNSEIRHMLNTFNYIAAVNKYFHKLAEENMEFKILDDNPTKQVQSDKPRVLILVVGETARAHNFSLYGYQKETNPLLGQNREIITFKDVKSCGTSTAISLPCMFADSDRKSFDRVNARHTQNLVDIIKLSGYEMVWLDNDDGCKEVCKRVDTIDMQKKNVPECMGSYCYDSVFFAELEERLAKVEKDTVLVVHTMGSHGPTYYKRYPEEFRKFTPVCDTADMQNCSREEIVNAYDNTILYTDFVLDTVVEILGKYDNLSSGMLYVSDHGESLGEHNIYLHAFPYKTAPIEQKQIPMILWLSENIKKDLSINESCLREDAENKEFSHDNYFHSVLRILGIETKAYNPKLDLFDKCISLKE